jgi:hypothetical protein
LRALLWMHVFCSLNFVVCMEQRCNSVDSTEGTGTQFQFVVTTTFRLYCNQHFGFQVQVQRSGMGIRNNKAAGTEFTKTSQVRVLCVDYSNFSGYPTILSEHRNLKSLQCCHRGTDINAMCYHSESSTKSR